MVKHILYLLFPTRKSFMKSSLENIPQMKFKIVEYM